MVGQGCRQYDSAQRVPTHRRSYAQKLLRQGRQNVSKVWGTHPMKFGSLGEAGEHNQPGETTPKKKRPTDLRNVGRNTMEIATPPANGRMAQYAEDNKECA